MAGLKALITYLLEWDDEMGDDARAGLHALLRSPLFEVAPRNVARDVLYDLEDDIRSVHGMTQICRALVQHDAEPDIIAMAVHHGARMAFNLEKKYDEAFDKAKIEA